MNTLKGLGAGAALAGATVVMHELADGRALLVGTVAVITLSTAGYLASRCRYRRDRRIVGE